MLSRTGEKLSSANRKVVEGTIIRWVGFFYLLAESISFATLGRKKSFEPKIEMKPILSKLVRRILGGNSMNFPLSPPLLPLSSRHYLFATFVPFRSHLASFETRIVGARFPWMGEFGAKSNARLALNRPNNNRRILELGSCLTRISLAAETRR